MMLMEAFIANALWINRETRADRTAIKEFNDANRIAITNAIRDTIFHRSTAPFIWEYGNVPVLPQCMGSGW